MKTLTDLTESHPLVAGAIGAGSGLAAKLLSTLHVVAGVAADIGMICGSATAVLGFVAFLQKRKRERLQEEAERAFVERHADYENHGDGL